MDAQEFENIRLSFFAAQRSDVEATRLVDGQGRETYAIRAGEGPVPLVLVHGGLDHAGAWSLVAGHLRLPIVIPDRPGCGLGYPIDYGGVDYRRAAAEWLRSVVDALGVQQVDLVGNSMGGYFAIAFATAYPDRVRNLILPGAPASLERAIPMFLRLLGLPVLGPRLTRMMDAEPEELRKRVFTGLMAHPERVPLELLELGRANAAFPSSRQCVHTMLRAFTTLWGVRSDVLLRDDFERLDVRTLMLWGDRDEFGGPELGKGYAERMPNAKLEVLEDVGHLPHLDDPALVAQRIEEFVASGSDRASERAHA